MSSWKIKKKETRSLKGYRKPNKGELKQGDTYYWGNPYKKKISNELIYDPESKKPIENYYIREIEMQIDWGYIYVKE